MVKGNSACEGDGKLAIAYVDRPLDEDKGSRYNFIVRRSQKFDFKIGLQEIRLENESDSEDEGDFEIESSWTLDFREQKLEIKEWDSEDEGLVD